MNKKNFPLLCTRNVIVFPKTQMFIDIGRPKSIKAIDVANLHYESKIVLVSQINHTVDEPTIDDIYTIGTLCEIKSIRRKDDYIKVIVEGIERVAITDFDDNGEYIGVKVENVETVVSDELEAKVLIERINKEIYDIIPSVIDEGNLFKISNTADYEQFSNIISQFFVKNVKAQHDILATEDLNQRLTKLLERIIEFKEMELLDREIDLKIKERFEENQKEYLLKEKIRLIKEELDEDGLSDIDNIARMFETEPFPKHVKDKAREEIKRYEMTPASSGESAVIRNYLEWLYKVPWYQKSEDNEDLNLASDILDKDHFGLEKVKERILEYLAVKKMTNSLKAPILCLVGPPGVGKTSLAKSIATSLNRKFIKQSVGGVKDESEIRGHRRTYLGSMPGRIIQGMKKAGTLNPVFLIDEIDKMASDYKGDPSSAMLEVLDPEQNSMFSDNYLEEPYDLSNVLFVATANYIENIPPALKDRLEIVELSSYTELEKVEISKNHLISKQALMNGLKPKQIKISDEVLLYLIRHYTKEAGVRNLERLIAKLCRKVVLSILKDGKKSQTITKKLVNEWIGHERFEFTIASKKDEVGVVTGLAYTSFGGDILPIEVTYFEGKGKLIVTGQLGDVMKESTEIALGWIKSNAKKYNIEPNWFEKHDIHIHAPEGAVPKDGPSAGITLTSAILSAILNKKAKKDVAMTGEITLRGNVLPIGGLKEKTLAAHRSGIKKILFPKNNIKDLDEVVKEVKESVELIPVSRIEEVLEEIIIW